MRRPDAAVNIRKASTLSIAANAMQILLVSGIALYVFFADAIPLNAHLVRMVVAVAAFVVVLGAAFDIRDALSTGRMLDQIGDMNNALRDMETLNNTLRAQRHDFLNHLQVVYSLMEMGENDEANRYIEKVYGSITAVSRVMKTANPSINALLQVKLAVCEKERIKTELNIRSAWKDLPVPGWEMCKVLSNLIDNAIDALREVEDRRLTLTLTEDLHAFRFSVANNGPMIPPGSREKIFQPGITTKSEGHGMGLFIVKKTLCDRGGDIEVSSDAEETCFTGWVPREIRYTDKNEA